MEAVKQGSACVGLCSRTHAVLAAVNKPASELSSYQRKVFRVVPPEEDAAAAAEERTTVLELFPQQAGTLKDEQQRKKRKEPADGRAPLTIFYGGKMVVFDDFPAEKAQELMQLAGSGGNTTAPAAAQNALVQPSLTGSEA